ncbi:MAG: hypothetical protein J7647_10920 [Cyanobacteria bacterium SBLK]|nr:hypothetical protein [Cyanobacteria bacterium SBLK]
MATATEDKEAIARLGWEGLRSLWQNIEDGTTDPFWESDKAFEYLVLQAFQLDGAIVRYPYSVRLFKENVEQIDGAVHCNSLSCIVESNTNSRNPKIERKDLKTETI